MQVTTKHTDMAQSLKSATSLTKGSTQQGVDSNQQLQRLCSNSDIARCKSCFNVQVLQVLQDRLSFDPRNCLAYLLLPLTWHWCSNSAHVKA